jgi:hydroxyethylthiazole kinase-like uncharacterized protein yjeF
MLKILNKEQCYEADQQTIKNQNIKSCELMERAGQKAAEKLIALFHNTDKQFSIFCGIGNNGGDGLVIARVLANKDFSVRVFITDLSKNRSDDFELNYERLQNEKCTKTQNLQLSEIQSEAEFPDFKANDVIVDAVFGIGLNRPAEGWLKKLFNYLNAQNGPKVAIDIPSGLYLNAVPEKDDAVISADYTFTVQIPKLVFFLPETGSFVGQFSIIDIAMDADYLKSVHPQAELVEFPDVQHLYKPRKAFSHKGTYGHALIAGGSYGKMGSVSLAAKAALHSGAGKVTALIPTCGYEILQITVPEIMTLTSGKNELDAIELDLKLQSLGFGIGAGTGKNATETLGNLLNQVDFPIVVDADGLNILSQNKNLLKKLPENSILTPHPGELKRLIGDWKDDFEKLKKVREFADEYKVILIVKGFRTLIFLRDSLKINSTGNPGMATAGSGDVLTGIITGLLAQSYSSEEAAILGVFLHGRAGDLTAEEKGEEALIAGDLIDNIGKAFQEFSRH